MTSDWVPESVLDDKDHMVSFGTDIYSLGKTMKWALSQCSDDANTTKRKQLHSLFDRMIQNEVFF